MSLNDRLYWPNTYSYVKNFVLSCETCIINKDFRDQPALFLKIPTGQVPNCTVHTDIKGPLKAKKKGNKYILTFICSLQNLWSGIPLKKLTTGAVSSKLYHYVMIFRAPNYLVSDNSTQFTSHIF